MTVVLSALSSLTLGISEKTVDPTPFLRARKSRKYMGTQDDLAVVAVGRALAKANVATRDLPGASLVSPERVGLFAAVGYIPFERADIDPVLAASLEDGVFSVRRFSEDGYTRAHPLLTFRCLPNMPAYHVSVNFGITGPYMVSYPGAGQAFLALEEAREALLSSSIDVAVVFATAHQRNFLVEHHYARLDHPVAASALRDASSALILERDTSARARSHAPLATLTELDVTYVPSDPLAPARMPPTERHDTECGAATPFIDLTRHLERDLTPERSPRGGLLQRYSTEDGLVARAIWEAHGRAR